MRQQAIPFPVTAPFGIDMDAVNIEGAFTPRVELLQQVFQLLCFAVGKLTGTAYFNTLLKLYIICFDFREFI